MLRIPRRHIDASIRRFLPRDRRGFTLLLASAMAAFPAASATPMVGGSVATFAEIESPLGIAARGGFVYVADFHGGRVWKLDGTGTPVMTWGGAGDDGALRRPSGIAIDSRGDVLVADFGAHAIVKYRAEGGFVTRWGTRGGAPGQFRGPFGIAADGAGHVYVTDLDNRRVQKFTEDGVFLAEWGSSGHEPGRFVDPMGIAVDSRGDLYVADHGNHRVQKFAADGRFLDAWGAIDAPTAYLLGPVAVAAANDAVYVTDLANPVAQKFASDGGYVTQWNEESDEPPLPGSMFGVAVEGTRVFVADLSRGRLMSFVDDTPSRVGVRPPTAFAMGPASPNPMAGRTTLVFAIPARARLRADVFDVNGRHVHTLADGRFDPGEHRLAWDGRADDGHPAAAGVYFVRGVLEGAGRAVVARVAVVR